MLLCAYSEVWGLSNVEEIVRFCLSHHSHPITHNFFNLLYPVAYEQAIQTKE